MLLKSFESLRRDLAFLSFAPQGTTSSGALPHGVSDSQVLRKVPRRVLVKVQDQHAPSANLELVVKLCLGFISVKSANFLFRRQVLLQAAKD